MHSPILDPAMHSLLVQEARSVAENAYAPYSNFRVGATVLGASGKIYRGVNVENASFGLSICAERVALASAKAAGEDSILAVGIACIDAPIDSPLAEKMPCGACRQWIQELAPDAFILISGETGVFFIEKLLPTPFTLARP